MFFSCHKKSDPPAMPGIAYDFTVGNVQAGVAAAFQCYNVKSTERWNFGDGTILVVAVGSGQNAAEHTYNTSGIFTVTLIADNDSVDAVKKQVTVTPNYSFTYTGIPMVGDTIYFHFPALLPSGNTYVWTFGDGTSSADSIPYHIYFQEGEFPVTLMVNGQAVSPVGDYIPICKDPIYTHRMTNMHTWHGSRYSYQVDDSVNHSIFTSLPDTSFALTYIDELTVSFNQTILSYNPYASYSNAIVFTNSSINWTSIACYNFVADSLSVRVYMYSQAPGQADTATVTTWHSP